MSSLNKTSSQGKAGPAGPSSQAILLEKLNRRSTPDSEALASSDDEAEGHRHEVPPLPMHQKPVRRASWLNDTSQAAARPRKGSFASSSMSPTASHPSTPAADAGTGAWGTHPAPGNILGRGHAGPSSFPWGTGIWNNDRKEPPSRLAEVLPSPTSTHPPGSSGSSFFGPEAHPGQTSPAPREQGPNSQIPFAIPLHPTPKTYRSQSYSVGQLDPDVVGPAMGSAAALNSRSGRTIPHSGLQHRPSRPSMLSEMSNDGGMLGKVKEVEDDDEEDAADPLHGLQSQSAEAKAIEMLTRENALLRQQASQQYHNARIRPRASTAATYGLGNGYGLQESVPEESDFAIDELEEAQEGGDLSGKRAAYRRMSEFGGAGSMRSPFTLENRKLENVKKAFWQSSLGFGGVGDVSQSRRHSFADVPTRHGSIGSIADTVISHEAVSQEAQHAQDFASPFSDPHNFPSNAPASYFTGGPGIANAHNNYLPAAYSNPYQAPYSMQAPFSNRSSSPHRSMYGMSQPNRSTPLHVVLFKCARADVFYIQEGTGLTVKPGDLVIVEADRGTDLGTVAADNVDWVEAKRLKEHYAEEQYKWLMMYSQTAGVAQDGAGAGLMAATNGLQGSAVGGMGPPGQHHMQEPNSGELKPKLIKRLAQNHEVQALRDKEGNEAKAKRVCMQKVKEHGLNMEILDAEFQMDWKKLTFYYFADSYINFNSLVTDLFKIYKTRIWMSAINPASFASQPLGLQAPSGIGPGAVGVGRGPNGSERRPAPQQEQQQAAFGSTGAGATPRPFAMSFNASFGAERPSAGGSGYVPSGYPYTPYGAFGATNRPANNSYGSPVEPFASGYPQGADYPGSRGRFSSPQSATSPHDQSVSPLAGPGDWVGSFQGLSLNSR